MLCCAGARDRNRAIIDGFRLAFARVIEDLARIDANSRKVRRTKSPARVERAMHLTGTGQAIDFGKRAASLNRNLWRNIGCAR